MKQPVVISIDGSDFLLPDDADAPRILKALSRAYRGSLSSSYTRSMPDNFTVYDRAKVSMTYPKKGFVITPHDTLTPDDVKEEIILPVRRLSGGRKRLELGL